MINLLNKLEQLPSSQAKELRLKDYIKGFGLTLWGFVVMVAPYVYEQLQHYDFGDYKAFMSLVLLVLGWFVQRYAKDTQG